jgi:hypothetical protein
MTLLGDFRFHASAHVYTVGKVMVPAVGTITKLARTTTDGPWMKDEHRDRGRAVHAATLAVDLGDSCQSVLARLEPDWRPFLFAYCEFRKGIALRWRQLEEPAVHRELMFAGTPDRVGTINDYPALLEIKTGHATDWHGIQTAGQEILLASGALRRYVVYLTSDGKFKLREHINTGDYLKFLTALQSYHEQHPLIEYHDTRGIRLREE